MSVNPDAVEGYVRFEQSESEPVLKDPGEAEALAMNLFSAAAQARAHRLAQDLDDEDDDQGNEPPERVEVPDSPLRN